MKKSIIFSIVMFIFSLGLFSQNPYYDAMELGKIGLVRPDNKVTFKLKDSLIFSEILRKYAPDAGYYSGLLVSFQANPFIALPKIDNLSTSDPHSLSGFNKGFNAVQSIGGLDVTNIADGFAKFMVKRTKEELNVAFFTRFKTEISSDKYKDLQTVFPQTCRALMIIGEEIYNYEAYIQTLREAFENDLSTLQANLPGIIDNHPEFFNKHLALAATLLSSCYIAGQLLANVHPGDILTDYPAEYLNDFNLNWKGSIQTLQLFSGSLKSSSQSDTCYWVTLKEIKDMVKDPVSFRIYMGLVYQTALIKYDSVHFQKFNLCKVLEKVAKKYDSASPAYRDYIIKLGAKTEKLKLLIKNHQKPTSDSLAFEQYYQYFKSSVNLLEFCTEAGKLPYVNLPHLKDTLKDYFDVAYSTGDLVLDINRRNYSSAVTNVVHIYNIIYAKYGKQQVDTMEARWIKKRKFAKEKKFYNEAMVVMKQPNDNLFKDRFFNSKQILKRFSLSNTEITLSGFGSSEISTYKDSLRNEVTKFIKLDTLYKTQKTIKNDGENAGKSMKYMFKYGTFMASVVQAKSSDDVEKAIEAAALPSGSSRIKRETPFNISLNAYTGLFIGYEKISGMEQNKFEINNYGVAAPIGVSVSTGGHSFLCLFPKNEGHWSYSAFFSLIDIGAVASFRFQNTDSVSQIPTIKLQDIISPGMFFSVGIPKCPLSLNFGAQVGPNLRSVYVEDNENPGVYVNSYQNNVYWRFSAALVVDIPIFNFYTKSKD